MTREQYLLVKLAEEASEIAKDAIKAAQFGMHSNYLDSPTNVENIRMELNDLLTVVNMLNTDHGLNFMPDGEYQTHKIEKIKHYMKVSESLGKLSKE